MTRYTDAYIEYQMVAIQKIRAQLQDWKDMFEEDPEAKVRMSYVINQITYALEGEQ
jgi:hypothetical protein